MTVGIKIQKMHQNVTLVEKNYGKEISLVLGKIITLENGLVQSVLH